jgi:hypothetical protein
MQKARDLQKSQGADLFQSSLSVLSAAKDGALDVLTPNSKTLLLKQVSLSTRSVLCSMEDMVKNPFKYESRNFSEDKDEVQIFEPLCGQPSQEHDSPTRGTVKICRLIVVLWFDCCCWRSSLSPSLSSFPAHCILVAVLAACVLIVYGASWRHNQIQILLLSHVYWHWPCNQLLCCGFRVVGVVLVIRCMWWWELCM